MKARFIKFTEWLHKLTLGICIFLFAVMALSSFGTVVLRYAFSSGFLWLQDLSLYSFSLLAVLSLPIAFYKDRHVRVDVFRQAQSFKNMRFVDHVSIIGFVFPIFLLLMVYSFGETYRAYLIAERSPQIGGLPFFYIVKAGIPIASLLMLIQAVGMLIKVTNTTSEIN